MIFQIEIPDEIHAQIQAARGVYGEPYASEAIVGILRRWSLRTIANRGKPSVLWAGLDTVVELVDHAVAESKLKQLKTIGKETRKGK
jgi:hypothetical protein